MFCAKCGSRVEDNQRFCMQCGAAIGAAPAAPKTEEEIADSNIADVAAEEEKPLTPVTGLAVDDEEELPNVVGLAVDDDVPEGDEIPAADDSAAKTSEGEQPTAPVAEASVELSETSGVDVLVSEEAAIGVAAAETATVAAAPTQASTVSPQPAPMAQGTYGQGAMYGAPQEQERGGKGAKIAAVIVSIVAVLAVAAVVAVIVLGIGPFAKVEQAQGDEPVECSLVTRIYPQDEEGNLLNNYTVTVIDRLTGETVAVRDVTDESGFTFGDITTAEGDPIPEGRYTVQVTNNETGKTVNYGDVNVQKDNEKAKDEQSIRPKVESGSNSGSSADSGASSSSSSASSDESPSASSAASSDSSASNSADRKKAMYQGYLDELNKLVEKYGETKVDTSNQEPMINGVSFARLVDFDNDGTEELVVAYYDKAAGAKASASGSWKINHPDGYMVEVIAFKDGKAKSLYKNTVGQTGNGGFASLMLYSKEKSCYFRHVGIEENKSGGYNETVEYYKPSDGEIKVARTFTVRNVQTNDAKYEVDGKSVSKDDYNRELAKEDDGYSVESYSLTSPSNTQSKPEGGKQKMFNVSDTAATVSSTVAQLEAVAKPSNSSSSSASAGSSSSASASKASLHVENDYYAFDLPAELAGRVRVEYPNATEVKVYGTDLKECKDSPILELKIMDAADLPGNKESDYSAIGNTGRKDMTVVYRTRLETSIGATNYSDKDEWLKLHKLCANAAKGMTFKSSDKTGK